jgi:flagellar motor switch protein FliN
MTDDLSSAGGERRATTAKADASAFRSIDEMSDAVADKEIGWAAASAAPGDPHRLTLVMNIPVRLSVELGRAEIPIREVVNVGRGSVIELDRSLGEPLDVRVNGVLIGHGEIVVFDEERLGLRFVDVVSQAERVDRLT